MTTTRATPRETPHARPATEPPRPQRFALAGMSRREADFLAGMLALAAVIRLLLAARGWPYSNSDEATIGLMVDDILRGATHPAFTYGEHHVGALDAYLQAPVFLALGRTNLALHVTTTIQYLLFLLVFYIFTRAVFSPRVAAGTLLPLAVGAELALLFSMRAGHHEQDTLLLGALLLWLTFLRLREHGGSHPRRTTALLDATIGLTAGLGLWSTILLVPFVAASALALGVTAYRRHVSARRLAPHLLLAGACGLIGLAPFLVVVRETRGVVLTEVLRASGAAGSTPAPGGPLGPLIALGQQLAGTFLFGLPSLFGSRTLCGLDCPLWPSPLGNPSPADALRVALIGAPFSALFIVCWWLAARPLLR